MSAAAAMLNVLKRKLSHIGPLSEEEQQVVAKATSRVRTIAARQDIVREGEEGLADCNLVLEGFAFRYKVLPGGRRQILSFQIAGDFCDIQSFVLRRMDHSIGTLTPCKLAVIPHGTIRTITESYPRIARALWRETLVDAAVYREWMASIGRRSAYQRIAHLLCEVSTRLKAVGLGRDGSYELPIIQADLADSLGLSIVHVNRTLQQLRAEGLITLRASTLFIHDRSRLENAGGFDPSYLQLKEGAP
jgi:CRP-like cAMP-binding protein